jgi:hypothetical protein
MQPSGFVALDSKHEIISEIDVCSKLIATFRVWKEIYFHPPEKHMRFGQKSLSRTTGMALKVIYEQCKDRLEKNQYQQADDPAILKLNDAVKKLDENVVTSYELLTRRLELRDRAMEMEKTIWGDPSYEKAQTYATTLLPALQKTNEAMLSYLQTRVNLTYESMKALREYESTLTLPKIKRLGVDIFAIIAGLYYPIYGIVVKLLDEAAKMLYRDFTGYKGLLKQMKELRRMQPRIQQIIDAFRRPVDPDLIRTIA